HDYTSRTFELLKLPITIGREAWVATEAFVGPGVEVGPQAVLGARSCAYRSLDAGMVYVGNPAKPLKRRELRD
ncbi:MAG: putative colanic acid biosynthesis acetyltransferase, partial [Phycisphaerales bacterium JB039]